MTANIYKLPLKSAEPLISDKEHLSCLLPHLERMDLLLQRQLKWQENNPDDRLALQELMLLPDEVEARLSQPAGQPAWLAQISQNIPAAPPVIGRLAEMVTRFGLSDIERDLLVLSLLPRLDSRYGAIFAFLQHGEARTLPTLETGLRLLCPDNVIRLVRQASLGPHSPLFAHGLVNTPEVGEVPRELKISTSVYRFLMGGDAGLPAPCTEWLRPVADAFAPEWIAALARGWHSDAPGSPVMILRGEPGSGRGAALAAAATVGGQRALRLDLAGLPAEDDDASIVLGRILRETRLWGTCLVLDEMAALAETRPRLFAPFSRQLAVHPAPVALLITRRAVSIWLDARPQILYEMAACRAAHSVMLLRQHLAQRVGVAEAEAMDLQALAQRFRLSPAILTQALEEADLYRQQRAPNATLEMADLMRVFGLRAQRNFGKLAQRLTPKRGFDDLMLTDEVKRQLHEVLAAIRHRESALACGFARKLGDATGISVLFYGDSGTGKTMAAEVLAGALGVDLIKVDLSTVVNKYIGETEKHLAKIFDLAAADAGVLFFDEADALFGKRSEVKDAQDRHANIEVSYLLQRLEAYPGLVILSTNNRTHLDDAFTRRLTFMTRFTFPDAAVRERMWRAIWPERITLASDVDLARLAARAEITGGNIRNIALLATWLSFEEKAACVEQSHIDQAVRRELSKMGQMWHA